VADRSAKPGAPGSPQATGPGAVASGREPEAARIERVTGLAVLECRPIGGSHGAAHYRCRLADGRELFVKSVAAAEDTAELTAEAHGLRWLGAAGSVPIPEVAFCEQGLLGVTWIPAGGAGPAAAERFGRDLASTHAAGADRFGAAWPGFIAGLRLPNDQAGSWPAWYAEHRLLPYCRLAREAGALSAADVVLIESVASRVTDLAGPAEPSARIHGDCWSGNVLWSGGRGWLIDPAAHGGHRESDLAMLALFGAPHLDRIVAAYQEVAPLAAGWRARVPLHQLHPLLVHVCLFGGGYRDPVLAAARAALAAR
jgi:fructosamine-3-kinase